MSGWERAKLILGTALLTLAILAFVNLCEWIVNTNGRLAAVESRISADAAAFEKLKLEAARGELAAQFIERSAGRAVQKPEKK